MPPAVSLLVEGAKLVLHPAPKFIQQWPGASLAYRAAKLGWLAANLFLDSVQHYNVDHRFGGSRRSISDMDIVECFGGSRRSISDMDIVEFTLGVIPVGDLVDGAVGIEMMDTRDASTCSAPLKPFRC
jgi:hypothetical protein